MRRAGLAALLLLLMVDVAQAQYWGSPYGRGGYYYRQPQGYSLFGLPWDDGYRPRRGPLLQSGGDRPTVDRLEPRTVSFPSSYSVGSIVIEDKVDIRVGATVEGGVQCRTLAIQEGAYFCGKVTMGEGQRAAHPGKPELVVAAGR